MMLGLGHMRLPNATPTNTRSWRGQVPSDGKVAGVGVGTSTWGVSRALHAEKPFSLGRTTAQVLLGKMGPGLLSWIKNGAWLSG